MEACREAKTHFKKRLAEQQLLTQLNTSFNKSSQNKFLMCGKHFKQSDFFMKVTESFKVRSYAQATAQ